MGGLSAGRGRSVLLVWVVPDFCGPDVEVEADGCDPGVLPRWKGASTRRGGGGLGGCIETSVAFEEVEENRDFSRRLAGGGPALVDLQYRLRWFMTWTGSVQLHEVASRRQRMQVLLGDERVATRTTSLLGNGGTGSDRSRQS